MNQRLGTPSILGKVEFLSSLKAVLENTFRRYSFSRGIFSGVGSKGMLFGLLGSESVTRGLLVGCFPIGFGKSLGIKPRAIHPSLLRYIFWTFLHMYMS